MKNKRKVAKISALVLLCSTMLGSVVSVNADTFDTSGGEKKTWNVSLGSTTHGGVIYRLTGTATQPQHYKFDTLNMTVTHYCNSSSNVQKSKSSTNAYTISTFADAAISVSANGKGTVYVKVSDDTYGSGSCRMYN